MTTKNLRTLGMLGLCLAAFATTAAAGAQTIRHDWMDARAARRDINRLKAERAQARANHNWGKVAQDNRLIANDRRFLRKDAHKVDRAMGIPPR